MLGKVDEADIGKVYFDQPARIVVESFKDRKFDGQGHEDLAARRGEGQRHDV